MLHYVQPFNTTTSFQYTNLAFQFSSVAQSCRLFATPWTAARQASLSITTLGVHPNPCPLSRWCHPTISSSVVPFSSCLQSFPASGSFPMSQLFASGGQRIGVSASASVLARNTQDWSPLGWTGWISLLSKGLSRELASPIQWTCIWVGSGSWWCAGKPCVLQSMGSQRVERDWATELTDSGQYSYPFTFFFSWIHRGRKEKTMSHVSEYCENWDDC